MQQFEAQNQAGTGVRFSRRESRNREAVIYTLIAL